MLNPQVESTNNQLKDITEKFNANFDIGVIAFLFNKSKYFIVLFFVLSFSVAFLYLRYSQSIYQSRAIIQINDANKADDILKLNNISDNNNAVAEAIEQIRSKVFLKRVVEKLDISVNYFNEGTFKNNELYHSSPYLIKINVKDKAIYGQKIYVEIDDNLSSGTIKIGSVKHKFGTNKWLRIVQ